MKHATLLVVALVIFQQLVAGTIVNDNPNTPALAMSPWTSPPIANFAQWNYNVQGTGTAQAANGTIYTVQQSTWTSGANRLNSVSATNGSSGATLWTAPTWNLATWLSVKGSTVVIATDRYFAGLNPNTGATKWNVSIVDGYSYDASTPAVWTDDDCIIAMVGSTGGYNSKLYHLIGETGAAMVMWNSTSLGTSVSSYYDPRGPLVVARMNSSVFAIQGFSNVFIALNLSNVSAAQPIKYTSNGSPSGFVRTPIVVNNSVYWFSGSSGSSYIYQFNMDLGGMSTVYTVDASVSLTISTAQLYNNNSQVGFAFLGSNSSSNCILLSTNLTGAVVGRAGYVVTQDTWNDYDCTPLAYGPNEIYVSDTDRIIYRYTYGTNGFAWRTKSMARSGSGVWNCGSGSITAQYVNGKLYYAGDDCYNNTYALNGWTVQMNTMTGEYESLLPVPSQTSSSYLPVVFLYDGVSFGGSVVQYARSSYSSSYDAPYLVSRVVSASAQKGTWLAGGAMINSPVTYKGKVYLFSADTVYCFGLQNGTLMWSQTVGTGISTSVNAVVAGGNLFVPSSSTSMNVYVFDLFNAVPYTMVTIPSKPTGCPVSVDSPTRLVSDPEQPYVYFAADDGECVVQFTKTVTAAIGSPSKGSSDVVNAPVLNGDYCYFNDYQGNMYYQRISSFSSELPLMRGASTSSQQTYASPSPVAVYDGGIYTVSTGAPDKLYRFGTKTLINDYVAKINSLNDNVAPLAVFGKIYSVLNNGSFACFPKLAPLLSKDVTANWVVDLGLGSTPGFPVWTNYGVFVFAASSGIIAVDYMTGAIKWRITQDANNRSLSCPGGAIATRTGVAYVQCNSTLYLIDIQRGAIWLTGSKAPSTTYVIDNSNALNLNVMAIAAGQIASFSNLTTRLYAPSDLPPSIEGGNSWLDIIKNNKIWIAAVVAVVVVLIIIIAVAVKLCGGGKKDTDYVAMQNPVNTGGV